MFRLPFRLPSGPAGATGSPPADVVNTGSYDVTIANLGFRLANDTQYPYQRASEKMSAQKISTSAEPGEQSLAELPWIREQSSFHGGAGQLNLETAYTAFQYQQEQIQHVRFDTSVNCDVWTPGKVKRLPDVQRSNLAIQGTQLITATKGGIDYAIVGGINGLYQVAWPSGPDSLPTISAIDLTSATYGGVSNCTVSSLTTDGLNYYAVLQLAVQGSTPGILTYVVSGAVDSTAAPTALYEVPNYTTYPPRTNLCTNPRFETNTAGWAAQGGAPPTLATASRPAALAGVNGTKCLQITYATGTSVQFNGPSFTLATTSGKTYTISGWAYVPTGSPPVGWLVASGFGGTTGGVVNQWVRVSYTFTATGASHNITLWASGVQTAGQLSYLLGVTIEQAGGVGTYFDGATTADPQYNYSWSAAADASTSLATPIVSAQQAPGICGWSKERLIGALANSVYELPANVIAHSPLPSAKYTRPGGTWTWTAVSESPSGVLVSGQSGQLSSILELTLDTSGNTPTLGGGASVAQLPVGEYVTEMQACQGSFLAIGTSKGLRVGTFDTFSGALTYGPAIWDNAQPVLSATSRDRFIYASYTNSQADGTSGLACVDLGVQTDAAGRNAFAPHLKPNSGVTGTGSTYAVSVLPASQRLVFTTPDGLFLEGNGPGVDGTAWLRTSRIREGTTIPKLFKLGQVRGALSTSQIQVTCIAPYGLARNCGIFGFTLGDPGEFRLIDGVYEWIQMKFELLGTTCELNSYNVQSLPQQHRQRVVQFAVLCQRAERDRFGMDVTDPMQPMDRLTALEAVEQGGGEVPFVQFTATGALVSKVIIQELQFIQTSRPSVEDDVGGIISITLRTTES